MGEEEERLVVDALLDVTCAEYKTEVTVSGRDADIVFPDHDIAVEVKSYEKLSTKGIGQATIYRTGGYESYLVQSTPFSHPGLDLQHPELSIGIAGFDATTETIWLVNKPSEYDTNLGNVFEQVEEFEGAGTISEVNSQSRNQPQSGSQ